MKDEFKGTKGPWTFKKEKGEQEWFVFQKGSLKKMHGCTIRTPVAEEINDKHDAELIASDQSYLKLFASFAIMLRMFAQYLLVIVMRAIH